MNDNADEELDPVQDEDGQPPLLVCVVEVASPRLTGRVPR